MTMNFQLNSTLMRISQKSRSGILTSYNFINILARLNDLQIGINILKLTLIQLTLLRRWKQLRTHRRELAVYL